MKKLPFIFLLLVLGCGRSGYLEHNQKVLDKMHAGEFEASLQELDRESYLKQSYNESLLAAEKGRLLFLAGKYEEAAQTLIPLELTFEDYKSFHYRGINGLKTYHFDNRYSKNGKELPPAQANSFEESMDYYKQVGGMSGSYSTGGIKAPDKLTFEFQDFEKPLVDFYVGLCGVYMNDDKPYVESRRLDNMYDLLNLRRFPFNPYTNAYSTNPFIPLISGFFYEEQNELNHALISYERALEAFESKYCFSNYHVDVPRQLIFDVYRLNDLLGFKDKAKALELKYNIPNGTLNRKEKYVILLIEDGNVPVKKLIHVWYKNGKGPYLTKQRHGNVLHTSQVYIQNTNPSMSQRDIKIMDGNVWPNTIMDLDYQVDYILKERIKAEHKPIPPASMTPSAKDVIVEQTTNYDSRSWQTLPARIHYVRIPVSENNKQIKVTYRNARGEKSEKILEASLKQPLQIMHVYLN